LNTFAGPYFSTSKASSSTSVEGHRTRQAKQGDAYLGLREDILEDPNVAAGRIWKVFSNKFEAQRKSRLFPGGRVTGSLES
jgi:hypothetical protein